MNKIIILYRLTWWFSSLEFKLPYNRGLSETLALPQLEKLSVRTDLATVQLPVQAIASEKTC